MIVVAAGCRAEPDALDCTTGWQVESETAIAMTNLQILASDHGVYAGVDGGWQWLDWSGAARGPIIYLPPGDVAVSRTTDRIFITLPGPTGVSVQRFERDAGLTAYTKVPHVNASSAWPFETAVGVLIFSTLNDGGVLLARSTPSTTEALPWASGDAPRGAVSVGDGLLLVTGSDHLTATPLTSEGRSNGERVVLRPSFNGAARLESCGGGKAALITQEFSDGGLTVTWLDRDGRIVKSPKRLPGAGAFPNLLCSDEVALAAWSQDVSGGVELSFSRVTASGEITPEPIALSAPAMTSNWYPVLRKNDQQLGLTWLRYSDTLGYRTMLSALRCKAP